jgi:hypothetical protein
LVNKDARARYGVLKGRRAHKRAHDTPGRRAAAPPENGTEDCFGISPACRRRPKSSTTT